MDLGTIFLSLSSGLIGVLVGGAITWWLQRQAYRENRKAAVRAAMIEMANVTAKLNILRTGNITAPISTPVWDANIPLILSAFSDAEARHVVPAYAVMPVCEDIRLGLTRGIPLDATLVQALDRTLALANEAGEQYQRSIRG